VIQYLDGLGELVLGGGLTANEIAALEDGRERAVANLQEAASLTVQGNTLRVQNLTGHKLISGYPEGRRMWIHARWYDAQGTLLREDGAYGPLSVTLDGQPLQVQTLLHVDPPDTRVYEVHFAITKEWAAALVQLGWAPGTPLAFDRVTGAVVATLGGVASQPAGTHRDTFHFALNDTISSDTRIPPYGMSYDEALQRSILPVPASQYGDPGPGGVFDSRDEIALAPPQGAQHATLELLYQPTSWEYVQFLRLSNDGSEAFLAQTGDDLLDAWLHTGMAAPQLMASTTWTSTGPGDPWVNLGFGLAGSNGIPLLVGAGTLQAGSPGSLSLSSALPLAPAMLFVSFTSSPAPFKGGTLVPVPPIAQVAMLVGAGGTAVLQWSAWPAGLPTGFTLYFQHALKDAAALQGVALSNALKATMP
jgi:hypothetical protein